MTFGCDFSVPTPTCLFPRQHDGERRIQSFLGGKLRGAIDQPMFFLADKSHFSRCFWKNVFFLTISRSTVWKFKLGINQLIFFVTPTKNCRVNITCITQGFYVKSNVNSERIIKRNVLHAKP